MQVETNRTEKKIAVPPTVSSQNSESSTDSDLSDRLSNCPITNPTRSSHLEDVECGRLSASPTSEFTTDLMQLMKHDLGCYHDTKRQYTPKIGSLKIAISNANGQALFDIARQGEGGGVHLRCVVARFKCCGCESRVQYPDVLKS